MSGVAAGVPRPYDDQRRVERYVSSGAYDADVARVVGDARAWLEKRAPTAARPAIVLDVDETALSNRPAYRVNGWGRVVHGPCDLDRGPCGLRAWQAMGRAAALRPTVDLVRRARDLGAAVFFLAANGAACVRSVTRRGAEPVGRRVPGLGATRAQHRPLRETLTGRRPRVARRAGGPPRPAAPPRAAPRRGGGRCARPRP